MVENPQASQVVRDEATPSQAAASDSELRRIRVVAVSNAAIMAVGLPFLFQFWRIGAMAVFWTLLATLMIVGLNVLALFRTRKIQLAGYVSTSALHALLIVLVFNSGGFYDPAFAWFYLVPLAAAFLVDLTALVIFLVLVLLTMFAFWSLPPDSLPDLVPAAAYPVHSLFNRVATLLSIGLMTSFFVRMQRAALSSRKQAIGSLREEIDAHTKTTRALSESEAEFRDLVENSADMIWTHDLSGNILSANSSFASFLGVPANEIVGGGAQRFVEPEASAKWDAYLKEIAVVGTYRGLMPIVDHRGRERLLEFHNTLRRDGVEKPLVRALARDVSKQMASQDALLSRVDQEQLMVAISTRFIDIAHEEIPSAVEIALGEIGAFLDCDRLQFLLLTPGGYGFERCAEWSAASEAADADRGGETVLVPWLLGRLQQFETVVVPNRPSLAADAQLDLHVLLEDAIESATIVPVFGREGLMGLLTLESRTEGREWLREQQALAHLAGVVFGNSISKARDEQRTLRLQEEIQQARKMESLGLIAGGIAHDFNNLLMVVLGNASLAMSQVAEGSGAQEALQAIDSSARSAAKLTAQMLAYAGGGVVTRAGTELGAVVELELEAFRARLKPGTELEASLGEDVPEVFGDPSLLRQLLRALLDNALEALEDSGGRVEVVTKAVELDELSPARGYRPIRRSVAAGTYGLLEVRDSGPGIDPASLEKIFDPFYTTKFAGRGLGLAAALGIVSGHEGVIEVESGSNGTRFRVFIPAARREERVRSLGSDESGDALAAGQSAGNEILIVDSNPEVSAVLGGLLEKGGFEPVPVGSAESALELLAQSDARFRAVVADLKIVESHDSLLALRWRSEHVPWILSSDERKEDIAERLAYAGASAFLSKPFEGRKLLSLIEDLLREYSSARTAL